MSEHNCPPSERCFPPAQTRPGDSSQCTTCPWANCISQDLEVDSTRTSVVKAPVIRNKTPGIVSRRQNITSTVPFNFITSRQLVRGIQGVDCLETVTRREPRGASQGVSIRIGEDEADSVPVLDGPQGQCHGQGRLAHAGRSQPPDVGGFGDEGPVGQFPNLPLVDGGLEGEVKLLQGPLEGEVGHLGPGAEVALTTCLHLGTQQLLQHLRIGQLLAGGHIQRVVQDLDGLLEPEAL